MSVLTRLVARATGQAAPGLTPRLPGRFEIGGGAGEPLEVHERTVFTPRSPAASHEAPPLRQAPRGESPAVESREARAPAPQSERPAPEAPEPVAPRMEKPEPARAEPQTPSEPLELIVTTRTDRDAPVEREAPEHPLPSRIVEGEPDLRRDTMERSLEVLLPGPPPADRTRRPSEPDGAMPALVRALPVSRNRQAAAPEPPEITVHIGRIDVVMAPEERKAAKRPEPRRPQMTELGDYLRGRESGR